MSPQCPRSSDTDVRRRTGKHSYSLGLGWCANVPESSLEGFYPRRVSAFSLGNSKWRPSPLTQVCSATNAEIIKFFLNFYYVFVLKLF